MKALWQLVVLLFTLAWVALVLATPLLSVWLATSLISVHGGPRELAVLGGALLFPILPLLWELRATRQFRARIARRKQLAGTPKRWLNAPRRIVLRTLALNVAFIAVLLVWFPQGAFEALATRGDWFLGDHQENWANVTRKVCFASASGLEWLYSLAHQNPYKKKGDDVPPPPDVTPTPVVPSGSFAHRWLPTGGWPDAGTPAIADAPDAPDAGTPAGDSWAVGSTSWPWAKKVDPYVAAMGPHEEQSLQAVGSYLASTHSDPFARVKALHDWVATRLSYDLKTLGESQAAADVFTRRTAVCEGYARLLVALGAVTGDRIVYLTGDVREENGEAAPVGHAWNAVQLRGAWYLIDATWDDPHSSDGHKQYSTDYLFIPPSVAVLDHFPDDGRWQLLAHPLSRGEFLRQPLARPGLAREGITMLEPDRPIVEVKDTLELKLDNPHRLNVMVQLKSAGPDVDCGVDDAAKLTVRCPVESAGQYKARIFGGRERYGTYESLAAIDVIRR